MELGQGEAKSPSERDDELRGVAEPAHKRLCTNIVPDWPGVSEPAQVVMRETILHKLSEPTVFRGGCKWPCLKWKQKDWARLFSEDVLSFRIGSLLPEGTSLGSPQWESECKKGEMTYSQFLEWMSGKRSCLTKCKAEVTCSLSWAYFDYVYMKDLSYADKLADAVDWGAFGFPERGVKDSTLWIGTMGANTPCHIDTYGCNLVVQIVGRKRWVLFPKSQSHLLSPTRVPFEESSIYSGVGFPRPSTKTHPSLTSSTPYVVTLEPGDVLFVPKQWWHSVENLEFSVSINTWLELPSDREERVKESIVRYQVASLCQGVHSFNLISSVFNPNMTDLAVMTPAQHLSLLFDSVFGLTTSRDSHHDGNVKVDQNEDLNIHTEVSYGEKTDHCQQTGETVAVEEEVPCMQAVKPLSMEPVSCVPILQYMHELYGPEVETGIVYGVSEYSPVEKFHSRNEATEFKQLKLMIDAFTDLRVVDVLKAVIDEKLGS